MAKRLAAAGVEAVFHDACDASATPKEDLLARCEPQGPWGRFRLKDMGCTISHLDALAAFLERDEAYCLMLEDDADPSADLGVWLADMSWWPADAEIVKIERWRSRKLKVLLGRPAGRHRGRTLRRLHSRHMGTAGYIVSRAGARRVVGHRPVNMPIDHMLFNMNASPLAAQLKTYQVEPALVKQADQEPGPARPGTSRSDYDRRETGVAYMMRELKRGLYEIRLAPAQMRQLVGGATLTRPTWKN